MFHPAGPTFLELARQALSSTERGYDLLAPKFEHTPFRTPDDLLEQIAARLQPVSSAADFCCGTGAGVRMLRPLCAERVVGLDFSAGMLQVARQREYPGQARLEWVQGNVLQPRFERDFDLVTCFGALGHLLPEDLPGFVDVVHRALRPGGSFVFVTLPRTGPAHWRFWALLAFDLVMRARNLILRPPFVMYYLAFTRRQLYALLQERGFRLREESLDEALMVVAERL